MKGYIKDPLNRDTLSFMATAATHTGYQFSTHHDIIKYEVEVVVKEMDCYVAPTFINLENPTFWTNQKSTSQRHHIFQSGLFNNENYFEDELNENTNGENLLRKIMFVNNIIFKFDFLRADFT